MEKQKIDKINFKKQVKKEIEDFEEKNGKCVYVKKANLPKLPKGWR